MPNAEKTGAVAELTEHFASASATVITEYRGLTVKQVTQLRRALGDDTTYAVVKNTLTKIAAAEAGVSIDDSLLTGPTAIAFVKGDPVLAAKGLRDFARTNPLLVIKGGVLDGKALSAAEVGRIADLESREVLLARLAGALKALPTRAAGLFQAPLAQLARLAKALEDKKSSDEPMIGNMRRDVPPAETPHDGTVDIPAADIPAADIPAADIPAADTPAGDTADASAGDTVDGTGETQAADTPAGDTADASADDTVDGTVDTQAAAEITPETPAEPAE